LIASIPPTAAAVVQPKKRLGVPAIIGIVLGVSFLGIIVVANLDHAGKACSDDGSLLAGIGCYEMMTSIESVLGVRSERLANAYTDLSLCYSKQTRMQDAMRAQEKSIEIQRELNGPDHPLVLVLTANLAGYKSKAQDYAGAEKILKDTLVRAEQHVPANPYTVGFVLNSLVDTYMAQHRWADAEAIAKRLAVVDDTLVAQGLYPFYGKESLAEIYARTGKLAEAESEARSALARANVSDRAISVPSHEVLAKVLLLKGKPDEAKGEFDAAMAFLVKKYGDCEKTQYWRARYDHFLQQKDPFKE
jgi:tetratricopeptide (TPR) repeat protein